MHTFLTLLTLSTVSGAASEPEYATQESKAIVEKMVEAHGGLARWKSVPTVSFSSRLEVNFGQQIVGYQEKVTVEQGRRRVYAELPNPDGSTGRIAYDGSTAWSAGDLQGIARAPARFTAWRNFYLYNLPWLTQDTGVRLGAPGRGSYPGSERELVTLPMSFADGVGDTPGDTYVLYIDPSTYRLAAAEYGMTYKSMLPDGATSAPRSVFIWKETKDVEGLIVPTRYEVVWKKNGQWAVRGEVGDWSFTRTFEESLLEKPADATIDTSTPR